MADAPATDRDALRRRLRDKIRGKRGGSGPELPTRLRDDPVTTMLAMGLDDPELLGQAKSLAAQPAAFLSKVTGETSVQRKANRRRRGASSEAPVQPPTQPRVEDADDEEAPPPA